MKKKKPLFSRRFVLKSTAAFAGSAVFLGGCATVRRSEEVADFIVYNGEIITQNPDMPKAQALAVKNGVVQAVGSNKDIRALEGARTRTLTAGGRTIIPGLNDSHQHPTRAGRFYAAELRWDGLGSLKTGLQMITRAASRTPDGQWVRVIGGWSPFQFTERRMPTPAELTTAAPNVPVYVLFLYSQGFLNRKAVELLGLTPATQAPEGTRYEFTPDGGCILHAEPNPDLLYGAIAALPPLSEQEQAISTQHYYRELNRFGLTSVIDAGGGGHRFPENYGGTKSLAEGGGLSLRISNYLFPQNKGAEFAEFQNWTRNWQIDKNMADGIAGGYVVRGAGEFLAWAAGDYENFLSARPDLEERPGWRKQLLTITRHLLQQGWPLRIHATYDESVNNILDVFAEAHRLERFEGRAGFAGIRWAIDHGETLQLQTIARVKAMGGGIAMQARMAYAGEYFKNRYGEAATRNAPPLRDVIDAGIPLGLGTDGTRVASYNPWAALYWATTGKSVGGTQLHGARHHLTREEALYYYTVGSAWFSREELLKGRLMPGQYADFAVLNAPFMDVSDEELKSIESVLTVMGGTPVYGANDFSDLMSQLPAIEPSWSPVRDNGGYQTI